MSYRALNTLVEADPARFETAPCVFLRAYWERKRAGRTMPARADVSPSEIRDHLGWVMILDVLDDGRDFRYRLIGTLVTQYFSTDATGKTVRDAFAVNGGDVAERVNAIFHAVARDKAVMRTAGDAGWLAKGMEEFEAIYLPLSDDGHNVTHILHAFVCDRDKMLLARQIARLNGGRLMAPPPPKPA